MGTKYDKNHAIYSSKSVKMKSIFVCHIIKYNFVKCSLSNSGKVDKWRSFWCLYC